MFSHKYHCLTLHSGGAEMYLKFVRTYKNILKHGWDQILNLHQLPQKSFTFIKRKFSMITTVWKIPMKYGCPKGNSFPSFVDAPKAFFFWLLLRKILFRRLANVPNLNFCLGGIHKLRKRIFLGAFIKHWNFLYRADHTKFSLDKCK